MMDCIFCKVIAGEIPGIKVWEDDDVFVFLDIHPLRKWHCLVIPKTHYQDIFDIDERVLQKIIVVWQRIAHAMKKSLWATWVNLINSSWKDAEQSVFHFHLHIVPRYEHDELYMNKRWEANVQSCTSDELQDFAHHLCDCLAS